MLDPLAEGLMFDIADTSWMADPELPPEWPAFAEWSAWMEENGYSVGDEDGEQPLPEAFGGARPSLAEQAVGGCSPVRRASRF